MLRRDETGVRRLLGRRDETAGVPFPRLNSLLMLTEGDKAARLMQRKKKDLLTEETTTSKAAGKESG